MKSREERDRLHRLHERFSNGSCLAQGSKPSRAGFTRGRAA